MPFSFPARAFCQHRSALLVDSAESRWRAGSLTPSFARPQQGTGPAGSVTEPPPTLHAMSCAEFHGNPVSAKRWEPTDEPRPLAPSVLGRRHRASCHLRRQRCRSYLGKATKGRSGGLSAYPRPHRDRQTVHRTDRAAVSSGQSVSGECPLPWGSNRSNSPRRNHHVIGAEDQAAAPPSTTPPTTTGPTVPVAVARMCDAVSRHRRFSALDVLRTISVLAVIWSHTADKVWSGIRGNLSLGHRRRQPGRQPDQPTRPTTTTRHRHHTPAVTCHLTCCPARVPHLSKYPPVRRSDLSTRPVSRDRRAASRTEPVTNPRLPKDPG